jgi:hypothetical protein
MVKSPVYSPAACTTLSCFGQQWIHIAPCKVARAGEVVQFVDEEAVMPPGIQVQREFGGRDKRLQ